MSNILKYFLIWVCSSLLLLGFGILSILWAFSANLPDYKFLKNYMPPVSSKVYSGDGELVSN
jgi:penicillin-binding protein 1A